MKQQILTLQRRLQQHIDNYADLKSEELYLAYKHGNYKLSRDQLDYLMCQAICAMPQHAEYIPLDLEWNLLHTIAKTINTKQALEPQLETIAQVVAKRDILDINDNWLKSVIQVYELIMRKNLSNIYTDLNRLKQLQAQATAKPKQAITPTFVGKAQAAAALEEEEECCDWLTRDFTAPIF